MKTELGTRCQKNNSTKTPFANLNGEICVQIRASGIPSLFVFIDGIRIARFPKDRHLYLKIDDAIAWHVKELGFTKRPQRGLKALAVLRDARERLEAELRAQAGAEHADGGMEVP
jgi:hypothetical protein